MGRGLGWKLGLEFPPRPAIEHPTSLDIAWAAGIWEGEGTIYRKAGSGSTIEVCVTQKDRWILERLVKLFGGMIHKQGKDCSKWRISGARARGFIMTIFKFLSPRRREQVKGALLRDGIQTA